MSLRDCKCGRPVRLGAMKIRVNRKNGIVHYIAHLDGSKFDGDEWNCSMFKPYPKRDEDKSWRQMVERWNAANPTAARGSRVPDAG